MIGKSKGFIYPTLLTAVLLLILLCILILIKNKNFEKEYSLDLAIPDKNFYVDHYGCSLEQILSFRNFKSYRLVNDATRDDMFKEIQYDIHKIIRAKDGKNGIHVVFDSQTKYGDVVRILDICQIENIPTYILEGYDIWIMTGSNADLSKNCPFRATGVNKK